MAELCHSSTGEMAFVLRLSTAVGEEGALLSGVKGGWRCRAVLGDCSVRCELQT